MIRVASFDIGKKNFAFVVEEFTQDDIQNINKKDLNSVYKHGKVIVFENLDLTANCNKKCYLDPRTFINMTDTLDRYAQTGKEYTDILEQIIKQNDLSDFEKVQLTNSVVKKDIQL